MAINTYITDPASKIKAKVIDGDSEDHALVVATRVLKTYENKQQFFLNANYGAGINQDASAGGVPVEIHDGTDSVLWTGSNIVGTADFADAGRANGGAASIGFDAWTGAGDTCQIAKGGNQVLTGYVSFTLYINVDNFWATNDSVSIYGWDTGTGLMVGTEILLENYFDWSTQDVWHKITIPFDDMTLTGETIDSIRFEYKVQDGVAANFYIDDIQIEQTGDPIVYKITPQTHTWLHVSNFMISIANNIASTLASGTIPGLAYNSFLGETLVTGLIYQRLQDGVIKSSAEIKTIGDWLSLPETRIASNVSDGTNTFVSLRGDFTDTIILKSEEGDELRIVISEDLTGLLHLKISAGCKEEQR